MATSISQMTATPLSVRGIGKSFAHQSVLTDVSLDIEPGELVCLLGPSGCGKTTLLRIIAGLEKQDAGQLQMGVRDITHAQPQERDYGILFQSYALFPNLSVAQNIAYGLGSRNLLNSEIRERVQEMLSLIGLTDSAKKYPSQLSGGQQQRVGLARALAPSPQLLLLDEPMSALDAKVRENLRHELRELQRRLHITTVMVTHDQDEAMVMADRIAVMNRGRIEQFDTPENIYRHPATAFVADFIGNANWLACDQVRQGQARLGTLSLNVADAADCGAGRLFCRPEAVQIHAQAQANSLAARVEECLFLGSRYRLTLSLDNQPEQRLLADSTTACQPGAAVWATLPATSLKVFPQEAV